MATEKLRAEISGDASGLESATKKGSKALKKMADTGGKSSKKMSKALKGVVSSTKQVAAAAKKAIGQIGTAGKVAVVALAAASKKALDLAREQRQAEAQLAAAIKSTGGAAGLTAKELTDMAAELQKVTNFGDEVTISAQAMLLTFTKIGRDVFPQALEAAMNLSVRMKTDLNSAILQVGKALNDPIRGVGALSRAGVQFTQDQKDMIKSLVKSGRTLDAQRIILAEFATEFKGAARAARDPLIQLGNAAGDVGEKIGNLIGEAILPLAEGAKELIEAFPRLTTVVTIATAAFVTLHVTGLLPVAKSFALLAGNAALAATATRSAGVAAGAAGAAAGAGGAAGGAGLLATAFGAVAASAAGIVAGVALLVVGVGAAAVGLTTLFNRTETGKVVTDKLSDAFVWLAEAIGLAEEASDKAAGTFKPREEELAEIAAGAREEAAARSKAAGDKMIADLFRVVDAEVKAEVAAEDRARAVTKAAEASERASVRRVAAAEKAAAAEVAASKRAIAAEEARIAAISALAEFSEIAQAKGALRIAKDREDMFARMELAAEAAIELAAAAAASELVAAEKIFDGLQRGLVSARAANEITADAFVTRYAEMKDSLAASTKEINTRFEETRDAITAAYVKVRDETGKTEESMEDLGKTSEKAMDKVAKGIDKVAEAATKAAAAAAAAKKETEAALFGDGDSVLDPTGRLRGDPGPGGGAREAAARPKAAAQARRRGTGGASLFGAFRVSRHLGGSIQRSGMVDAQAGEFMLRRQAAAPIRPLLEALNRQRGVSQTNNNTFNFNNVSPSVREQVRSILPEIQRRAQLGLSAGGVF